ncbi:MAG: RNA polymerase sigma factor RpoD/SigA [Chitinophagaceae bacterium]|nr:MAG: RNA polymerase sigma factor RpoD/SigA [Chitinophagaceae bacterium]
MRPLVIQSLLTPRKEDRLDRYLAEINRLPLIPAEEEIRLSALIKEGDIGAMQQLVHANLRFVVSVAKQYQHRGLPLSDLINEGNHGLVTAAHRFDPSRGFKFISYAVWWIRQNIVQALSNQGRLVRLPANRVGDGLRIFETMSLLEQELERSPSLEEVAEKMGKNISDVRLSHTMSVRHESLDAPMPGREDGTLQDELSLPEAHTADHRVAHTESLHTELSRSLAGLKARDRSILCAFFGIDRTQSCTIQEIADELGMSTERIRQIRDKALRSLRARGNAPLLQTYL